MGVLEAAGSTSRREAVLSGKGILVVNMLARVYEM